MDNNDNVTGGSDDKKTRRMLVADDDPAILKLIATILEKENFTVVTARDGREAYKTLQADADFTAAILDVVMPHITGPELVRFMKAEERLKNIPVVLFSTSNNATDKAFAQVHGANYVTKPFTYKSMEVVVKEFIRMCEKEGARRSTAN